MFQKVGLVKLEDGQSGFPKHPVPQHFRSSSEVMLLDEATSALDTQSPSVCAGGR